MYIQFQKDVSHRKLKSQVEIDILRKEYNAVTETNNSDEATFKSELEKLEAEKDKLLVEQQAQHLDIDTVIANLQSQLKKVAHANDIEDEAAQNLTFHEHHHSQNSVRDDTSNRMQSNRSIRYFQSSQSNRNLQSSQQQVRQNIPYFTASNVYTQFCGYLPL